jgi:hypothetical protein
MTNLDSTGRPTTGLADQLADRAERVEHARTEFSANVAKALADIAVSFDELDELSMNLQVVQYDDDSTAGSDIRQHLYDAERSLRAAQALHRLVVVPRLADTD